MGIENWKPRSASGVAAFPTSETRYHIVTCLRDVTSPSAMHLASPRNMIQGMSVSHHLHDVDCCFNPGINSYARLLYQDSRYDGLLHQLLRMLGRQTCLTWRQITCLSLARTSVKFPSVGIHGTGLDCTRLALQCDVNLNLDYQVTTSG